MHEARAGGDGNQAVHPPRRSSCRLRRCLAYRQRDDRDFDFGRLADDGFLLCDGQNMGHRGVLTSNVVMLATVLSSVSLTLWIFLLRLFGLL